MANAHVRARPRCAVLALVLSFAAPLRSAGDSADRRLTSEEVELFLRQGKVVRSKLPRASMVHYAHVQSIDGSKIRFETAMGRSPNDLVKCNRNLLAKMRLLTKETLTGQLGDYPRSGETGAILE